MPDPESKKPISEKSDLGINNDLHQKMQKVFGDYSHFKNNKDFLNAFTKASEAIRIASGKNLKIDNPKTPLGSLENATQFLNEITRLAKEANDKKENVAFNTPSKLETAPLPPIRKVGPPVLPRDPNLKLSTADTKPSSKAPQRPPPPVPIGPSVTKVNTPQQLPTSKAPQRPPPPIPTGSSVTKANTPQQLPASKAPQRPPPPILTALSTKISGTVVTPQPSAKPGRRPLPMIPQMQSVMAKGQQVGKSKAPDVKAAKPPKDHNKKLR